MRRGHRLAARLYAVFAALCVFAASSPSPAVAQASVAVFTDGLAEPGGAISRAVAELSEELGRAGGIRLLSVMGQAGAANLHDLLRFRGADLAVMNADVIAAPDLAKTYPGFQDKLRFITRLRVQRAVLLARGGIDSVQALAGRDIVAFGPDGATGYTARTMLGALGVKAEVVSRFDPAAEEALAKADAVFLFEADAARLPASIAADTGLRAVVIPLSPALARIYRAGEIRPGGPGVPEGAAPVATIETDTILASYNWLAQHGRYADVNAFISAFFGALPNLRTRHPGSIWSQTDPRASVPGWRQYAIAATAAKTMAALPPPPKGQPQPQPQPQASATTTVPAFVSTVEDTVRDGRLRLSILAQPPLTDQNASGGGLLTQLAMAALERAELPGGGKVELRWEKDRASQTQGLLVEKRAELGFPLSGPGCDATDALSGTMAALCDGGLASDPIFKGLVVFFVAAESDFNPGAPSGLTGRSLCVPANRDFAPPSEGIARMIRDGQIKLTRPPTMIDCLDMVGRGETDALLVNELEGKRVIADLGLTKSFRAVDNAGFAEETRLLVARDTPKAEDLLKAVNRGIARLKADAAYGEIIMRHVVPLNRSATAR